MNAGWPDAPDAGQPDRSEEVVEHLLALVERLRIGFEVAVSAFDLSPAQAKALRYLAQAGPVPMRELAERLACDASNVTGIIDRLEQRGLVERRLGPVDRRVKTLVVTARGAEIARAMWSHVRTGTVGTVTLSDAELFSLLDLLRRLDQGASAHCWARCSAERP